MTFLKTLFNPFLVSYNFSTFFLIFFFSSFPKSHNGLPASHVDGMNILWSKREMLFLSEA